MPRSKSITNPNLTKEQQEEIKRLLSDERIKQMWIASKFKVDQSTVAYYKRKLKKVA